VAVTALKWSLLPWLTTFTPLGWGVDAEVEGEVEVELVVGVVDRHYWVSFTSSAGAS
jgi:hypothetical protein